MYELHLPLFEIPSLSLQSPLLYCARHSCGTNLLSNGANIKIVASILGHSGLAHTEKYLRAVDSHSLLAIDSPTPLEF